MDNWKIHALEANPEKGRPCYILIEDDVVYCESDQNWQTNHMPFVRLAEFHGIPGRGWKLLDYDEENEEEFLNTNIYSVIFYRYVINECELKGKQ